MKLFVSDYDLTLFVNNSIEEKSIEAINEWQKSGNMFAIATGRNRFSIQREVNKYNLKPDYIICNNGSIILDYKHNVIFEDEISREGAYEVIKYIYNNYEGSIEVSNSKLRISIEHPTENNLLSYEVDKNINIKNLENIDSIIQINKKMKDTQNADMLSKKLNDTFKKHITAYANIVNIDIVKNNVNKANAIEYILKMHNSIKDIIAAGDSNNDMDMIKKYEGYAPNYAKENIKNAAKHIFSSIYEIIKINI